MRTNIDLDDDLLDEFKRLSKTKTKKEAVNKALEEGIRQYKVRKLLDLRGKVEWIGDLNEMRTYDPWKES